MTDERKSSKWWQTAPGALTAVAAFFAAISGLIGGLNQIGVFDRLKRPAPPAQVTGSLPRADTGKTAAAPARRPAPTPPRRALPPHRGTGQPAPAPGADSSRAAAGSTATTPPPPATSPAGQGGVAAPAESAARAPVPSPAGSTGTTPARPPAPESAPAPPPSSTRPAADTANASAAVIPSGTTLELAAQSRVCSTTSQPGDHFAASVVVPVAGSSGVLVPAGSTATLEVTRESPPAFLGARVDSLVVNGKAHPVPSSTTTRVQREFVAGPGDRGVGVGACIPAGGRITATLTGPVSLR